MMLEIIKNTLIVLAAVTVLGLLTTFVESL